jgi:hypothetical protein
MTTTPETKYVKSGDVYIAYQVVGDGPRDLVLVPPFVSHVELYCEEPYLARFLNRLASFSRLICSISAALGSPTAFPILLSPTWSNGWTTCGRSWTLSGRKGQPCSVHPRAVR